MLRLFAAFLLLVICFLAATVRAQQPRCQAPRVMLVVDKSSSMLGEVPEGISKWEAARMAIGEISTQYAERIDLGLQVFPNPGQCSPGTIVLPPAARAGAEVVTALGAPPPSAGNWTPMAQTLDVLRTYAPLADTTRARHVILVTDGWQWCSPYVASTRFAPVQSVSALRAMGVTVHVVGFGAAVDALTLNRAAVAAGTELPGCDATGTEPSSPNHCYAQADDLRGLRLALDAVARSITDELCDGFDNDCDGVVDDGFDRDGDGYSTCGSIPGTPGGLDPRRVDCADTDARVNPGAVDTCDGHDEDCDGVADPGCSCVTGSTRACGNTLGACVAGTQRCVAGAWGACEGETAPSPEQCDGRDEDCDGETDEDATCGAGFVCTAARCTEVVQPIPPAVDGGVPGTPESEEPPVPMTPPRRARPEDKGSCHCAAPGGGGGPEGAAGLGLLGLALLFVRRRRG